MEFEITQEDINSTANVYPRFNGCAAFVALKRRIPGLETFLITSGRIDGKLVTFVPSQQLREFTSAADWESYCHSMNQENQKPKPQPGRFTIGIPDDIVTLPEEEV